jgi:PAS domain S-box-containing protein
MTQTGSDGERLRHMAARMALVGGWSVEAADRRITWSDEIHQILDSADRAEPLIDHALDLYSPDERAVLETALEACFADGTPFDLEVSITTYAGRVIPVRIIAEAEFDDNRQVVRVVGALQDISDLRLATRAAEQSAHRLLTTLESMTDALYTLDSEWRFTFVNERAAELIQRAAADVLGKSVWEEFPDALGTEVDVAYHRAIELNETQVITEFHYPPLETWFDIYAYPSTLGLAVDFRDVTSSRAALMALEQRELILRRQAALLDEAQDAILVHDTQQRITYWNRGAERLYGWTAEDAVGAEVRALLDDAAPDGGGQARSASAALFEHGSWRGELARRTRSGEHVTVLARWTLVHGADGAPEAVLCICTDITEQRRLERQLLRSQRMESIGTLAGGIAHDLNNLLAPVMLAAEMLQMRAPDADSAELLGIISVGVQRGADLVDQVLSFARGADGPRSRVDVRSLLADLHAIVRDTFPKNLALELTCPNSISPVFGDSTQIQQVLLNLAVNARDAMPHGGTLRITAREAELGEPDLGGATGVMPGWYVQIDVADDGTGMSPAVMERVFEPFFTTKPQGAGTGLGLSTAAAIVRSHGGVLQIDSEPGRGSRFRLCLPRLAEAGPPLDGAAARGVGPPRGHGETILVVDDEDAVRAMACRTFETHGYHTLEAANGEEALAVYAGNRDRISMVVTDMMMPVMDGPTLINVLRADAPQLCIAGVSGLHRDGFVAEAAAASGVRSLPKPFTQRQLLELVDDVLNRR